MWYNPIVQQLLFLVAMHIVDRFYFNLKDFS